MLGHHDVPPDRLLIDEIKVDRSFVMQMNLHPNDTSIVQATVDLGANLGLRVVAEGVEDAATWERLAEMGCDQAQGFHLARPMGPDQATAWLRAKLGPEGAESGRLRAI